MTTHARPDGGRRALQVTLGVLSGIPFASGLAGMIAGPAAIPGGPSPVPASVDSEYRYAHATWFAAAPVIWSAIPHVERQTTAIRAVSATVFLGGLARLLSWRVSGRPHPVFVTATAVELLAVPALFAWHRRVEKAAAGQLSAAYTART